MADTEKPVDTGTNGHLRKKPCLIVDTGTLLTLLLADENIPGYQKDIGLLRLLVDLAEQKVVKIVLTDMVLAEFLNSPVPLYKEDLVNYTKRLLQHDMPKAAPGRSNGFSFLERMLTYRKGDRIRTYAKAHERVEFLRLLLETGELEIVKTDYGNAYLEAVRQCVVDWKVEKSKAKAPDFESYALEDMRRWFIKPDSDNPAEFAQWERMRDRLVGHIRKKRLRADAGETSIGDVLSLFNNKTMRNGKTGHITPDDYYPIILYQGTDVRARIIERFSNPGANNLKFPPENPKEKYNPHIKIKPDTKEGKIRAKTLAFREEKHANALFKMDGAFLTTYGFLLPFMLRFDGIGHFLYDKEELYSSADTGKANVPWKINRTDPARRDDPEDCQLLRTFKKLAKTAAEQMGGRYGNYLACKDVRFADVEAGVKHEHIINDPLRKRPSPWLDHVSQIDSGKMLAVMKGNKDYQYAYREEQIRFLTRSIDTANDYLRKVGAAISRIEGHGDTLKTHPDLVVFTPAALSEKIIDMHRKAGARR